jgi:hypothetical protein
MSRNKWKVRQVFKILLGDGLGVLKLEKQVECRVALESQSVGPWTR